MILDSRLVPHKEEEDCTAVGQKCCRGPGESHRRGNVSIRLGLPRWDDDDDASDESDEGSVHCA